ncbi:MAG: transporter substrate-binding domain-containing protein [Alphaproteobacteria bacterium]|nr:transporter substrate-binding domain-containing protein [Alphaproteobacteria bacterium]
MNKGGLFAAVIVVAALTTAAINYLLPRSQHPFSVEPVQQPAFDRVIKSNKLRCGYIVLPPEFTKDPNTGAFGGIGFDVTEDIAKNLNLKVEWVEEVNFVTLTDGLKTGRYDALCFPLYLGRVAAARELDFTIPFMFTGTSVFVREDDHRFDGDSAFINSPDITVATMDGEASQFIRLEYFPATKDFSLPQTSDVSQILKSVADKKADVTFADQSVAAKYLEANPGVLRDLTASKPIRLHGHMFAVNKGETKLAAMLSMALQEMIYAGRLDKILDTYDATPASFFFRPAKPYQ